MPPAVIPALTAIAALASAAGGIYSATKKPKVGGIGEIGPTGPGAADLAARGATRPDFGAVTPAWQGGITGASTPGPLLGAGSAVTSNLGQQADDFASILKNVGGGGIGGT